jgi:ATPase family associated with various cellular activities (AAA)
VARLLARGPHELTLGPLPGGLEVGRSDVPGLAALEKEFGLVELDLALLVIAVAPELDLRYERLYAYLQDDVTRRRPTVDLALGLLCPSIEAKIGARTRFSANAPLLRHGLLRLIPDPSHIDPPLLALAMKPDELVVRVVSGVEAPDSRLASFVRLVRTTTEQAAPPLDDRTKGALGALADRWRETPARTHLHLHGPPGSGRRRAAETVAAIAGLTLLEVDLARAIEERANLDDVIPLLFREARVRGAALYLAGTHLLQDPERALERAILLDELEEHPGPVVLGGSSPWPVGRRPEGLVSIELPVPEPGVRSVAWSDALARIGQGLGDIDLRTLAERYRLTPGQIDEAVAVAGADATWAAALSGSAASGPNPLALEDLAAAARSRSATDLARLARRVTPIHVWEDLVLPPDAVIQLRELCARVTGRHRVLEEWGFGRKLSLGRGVNALFAGPSGTGKTMAAEIVAGELGLELYKIDLSGVVSKYIGETEKNLDRIFQAAEGASAILFFDEADALFGRRSEVRDSHDRYANIEISYLLQKMEEHDGVAILASNLRQNLDESFVRRLSFTVHFPFPEEAERLEIWRGIWPDETPLAPDVDLGSLAARFKLSGGNIRNVSLSAAFLAAQDGGTVTMAHLSQAIRREFQKLGKAFEPFTAADDPGGATS